MKRILCVLIAAIWLCTCWAGNGKKTIVWEQPIAESNQLFYDPFQSQLNIYRVEFADDETRVFMHITFPPHYWVKFVKETYLLADGKKYLVKSCDGLKLDEEHYTPSSGKEDVSSTSHRSPRRPESLTSWKVTANRISRYLASRVSIPVSNSSSPRFGATMRLAIGR